MAFLNKEGLQNLTNKIVQGENIKTSSHRGHTVTNVIDNITRECDNVANPLEYKIENRVTEFKIGQGRDADVSGDVEKGYSEIEFKGKTYQNLINGKPINSTISSTTHSGYISTKFDLSDKVYTYMFTVNNLDSTGAYYFIRGQGRQTPFGEYSRKFITQKGRYTLKVDLTGKDCFQILCGFSGQGSGSISDVILLEGDYSQTPIEELPKYFEGIKSSFEDGVVDVDVVGKNKFKVEMPPLKNGWGGHNVTLGESGLTFTAKVGWNKVGFQYPHLANKVVTVSADVVYKIEKNQEQLNDWQSFAIANTIDYGRGKSFNIKGENNSLHIASTLKLNSDGVVAFQGGCNYEGVGNIIEWTFSNIQIEENSTETKYEPYNKKKILFNIGEPLRSTPSGVCDEIRNNNDKWELIRRVGKIVFEGKPEENWRIQDYPPSKEGTHVAFRSPFLFRASGNIWSSSESMLCNILLTKNSLLHWNGIGSGGIGGDSINAMITMPKTNSPFLTVDDLKEWLHENPVILYYELETPIITPIESLEFENQPLGSITINSDIAPTSYHNVILNRGGQIEKSINDIAELRKEVDRLEELHDNIFINTQYKLSMLDMEYKLNKEDK